MRELITCETQRQLYRMLRRAVESPKIQDLIERAGPTVGVRNRLSLCIARWVSRDSERVIAAAGLDKASNKKASIFKKQLREAMADELRSARKKLRTLKEECLELRASILELRQIHGRLSGFESVPPHNYPEPPQPILDASEKAVGVPAISGVYFVWREGVVVYVGQSINLASRCNLKSHHAIRQGDRLSWIEVSRPELLWTEAVYIGLCRPTRNFGDKAYRLAAA
jgi:hypothetical protein